MKKDPPMWTGHPDSWRDLLIMAWSTASGVEIIPPHLIKKAQILGKLLQLVPCDPRPGESCCPTHHIIFLNLVLDTISFYITESNICRKKNFMVCFVSNAPEELELLDWQDALLSPTLSQESALASAQWVRTWWNLRNSWWIVQQFSNLMSARSCCALVRHSPWSLTRVRSSLTQLCSTLAEKYTFLQFFSVFSPFHPWEQ